MYRLISNDEIYRRTANYSCRHGIQSGDLD